MRCISRAIYLNEHAKSAHVFARTDEEKQSGIQQSHREPGIAAEMRSRFPKRLPVFRKGATADGARRGRSVYECNPLRVPFTRRSTHLVANGRIAQMCAHAVARLRRTSF